MDFASFAARAHAFDLHPLTPDQLRKLARLFDRGTPVADILSRYAAELGGHPPATWRRAREIWREHLRWREAVRSVSQRRLAEGLQLLPDEAILRTWSTAGLRLLEDASERLPLTAFPSHAAWHDALTAVADAFQGAQGVLLRQGAVHLEGDVGEAAPEGPVAPLELPPSTWLLARRAEAEGHATIRLERPDEDVGQELVEPAARVAAVSEGLDADAIVRALVHDHLEAGARDALDRRAVTEVLNAACERFQERIQAPPLRSERTGALFVGDDDAPVGLAVVGREGRILVSEELPAGEDGGRAAAWLAEHLGEGDPVVVPAEAHGAGAVRPIEESLQGHEVHAVHADGLRLSTGEKGRAVDAARALAQRAFRPRRTWSEMGPDELNLLPPGVVLDADDDQRLRDLLAEVAEAARAVEPAPKKVDAERKPRPESRPAPAKRRDAEPELNPGVKSLRDVEPGASLRGKVTNVNRFGAFVDVGIAKEGLVPIRSLTDGFADNPTDVVRAGQRVKVRVVSVDRQRRRFEVSLEHVEPGGGDEARPDSDSRRRGSGGRGGGGRRRGSGGGGGGRPGGGGGGGRPGGGGGGGRPGGGGRGPGGGGGRGGGGRGPGGPGGRRRRP